MTRSTGNGITETPSNHSVDQTVEKLKGILQARGVTLFALVDHSGEAEKVGLKMPPTKLAIFGSPKAGTPLMLAAPTSAIDLPLKILIWEDANGKVWVSYNAPAYLQERHGIREDLLQNIAVVETLAAKAAEGTWSGRRPNRAVGGHAWRHSPECQFPPRTVSRCILTDRSAIK